MGLELTTDRYPSMTSQTCYPLRQAASIPVISVVPYYHYYLYALLPEEQNTNIRLKTSSVNFGAVFKNVNLYTQQFNDVSLIQVATIQTT